MQVFLTGVSPEHRGISHASQVGLNDDRLACNITQQHVIRHVIWDTEVGVIARLCLSMHGQRLDPARTSSSICLGLIIFGNGVDETGDKTYGHCRHRREVHRVAEEYHSRCRNRQFVQRSDHATIDKLIVRGLYPMGMRMRETNLYVVLLVVLTHQAVVYDMNTAAAPDMAIRVRRTLRVAGGLECRTFIRYRSFLAAGKKLTSSLPGSFHSTAQTI